MNPIVKYIKTHENIESDEGNKTVISFSWSYKGNESDCNVIWDYPDLPSDKDIKKLIKTIQKGVKTQEQARLEDENKYKKEMKLKQKELDEMRKFVNSRSHDPESTKKAIEEFKKLKSGKHIN